MVNNLKTVFLIKSSRSAYLQFACASQGVTVLARRGNVILQEEL